MSSNLSNIAGEAYSATAELGRFQSQIGLYSAICIGITLILIASWVFSQYTREPDRKTTSGTIASAKCSESTRLISASDGKTYPQTTINCTANIKYTVDGNEYYKIVQLSGRHYVEGETVTMYYNQKNPHDADVSDAATTYAIMSVVSLVVAVVLVAASYYSNYLSQRFKIVAAAQGTKSTVSIFKSMFN